MQNYSLFLVLDRKSRIIESESLSLSLIIGIIVIMTNSVFAQAQQDNTIGVKIISPITGQQVPVGELTISGISTDNAATDCTVYADWNNTKPFQKAIATGPGGVNDYSIWTFTYTKDYHLIINGSNNLTSKLSCIDNSNVSTANLTKFYSVNVIGVTTTDNMASTISTSSEEVQQQESPTIDSNITSIIERIRAATAAVPESNPSVPSTSSVPLSPSIEEKQEPTPAPKPEGDQDTTIYWDIEL